MVNTLGSGGSNNEQELRKTAEELGVSEPFDREMIIPLTAGEVLAYETQEQANMRKIDQIRGEILSGGSLGDIARVCGMSVIPDSIDDIGPTHEYTKEQAQLYLDKLNKRYPIREVLGEYYESFLNGELKHIFQASFAWDNNIESKFYELIRQSAVAGKWVGLLTTKWTMEYVRDVHPEDIKTQSILENDALGFYEAYPEARRFLEDYEQSNINPLTMVKRLIRLIQMHLEMKKIISNMDEHSRGVFLNKIAKIGRGEDPNYIYDLQIGIFPKEHLIQDLMRRLSVIRERNSGVQINQEA